jgi:hypothetical protein
MIKLKRFCIALAVLLAFVCQSFPQSTKDDPKDRRREELRMAVQEICPMTGDQLKSDRKTWKWIDPKTKETLYVCCEECMKSKPDEKHIETIRSNFAKAQAHCLVMTDNEITPESKFGIVEGHAVFVCCPPCIKKMQASPEKFLKQLDDLYEAYVKK